ncbi:MAG: hypothetical protein RR202_08100 [Bacteroidales bacterium]
MLENIFKSDAIAIYRIDDEENTPLLNRYIVSSQDTREICNDPQVCGIEYTSKLEHTCMLVLKAMPDFSPIILKERQTMVLNVLRGGLNFGLREALAQAYGWNIHSTSFISAQRTRVASNSEEWHIIESEYKKLYLPENAQIVFGDVVATGTSLQHALKLIVKEAIASETPIANMVFFTFGGERAEVILREISELCKKEFEGFSGIDLFYLEGRFMVPSPDTLLSIKLTGTDLVRKDALMAPEFIASQYELPYFPLERCVIYDAGSRAFHLDDYVADVVDYWSRTKELAAQGITFNELIAERFPNIDPTKFGKQNLMSLCEQHIGKINRLLIPKENTQEEQGV